jgi:hypothetical protein
MSVLIEARFCNWCCLFLAVFFVFTVAGIHHQSYFGITARILHTQNPVSVINTAKCIPQSFSNIKNISGICKPVKCHQT